MIITVDPKYDLRRLLTPQFQGHDTWNDMATAMSHVFFEKVEQQRIALSLAREPENIARVFKISTAKLLGFNFASSVLTDEDYNRILRFISIYNPEKGTKEFIKWLGMVKNAKLDILPLWSANYKDFFPGIPIGQFTIFQNGQMGSWFPTTHVGLVYDELITQSVSEDELRDLFYLLAPINLVLKWIAAVITIVLPTIYLAAVALEECEILIQSFVQYIAVLFLAAQVIEECEIITVNTPIEQYLPLQTMLPVIEATAYAEVSWDLFQAAPEVYWDMDLGIVYSPLWAYSRPSEASLWNADGTLVWLKDDAPRISEYDPVSGQNRGWLFEPERTNTLRFSTHLTAINWGPLHCGITDFNIAPDSLSTTTRINKNVSGEGYLRQTNVVNDYGSWCFSAVLRESGSRYAAIMLRFPGPVNQEGGVVVDLETGNFVTVNPSIVVTSGVIPMGGGFFRPWVVIDNQNLSVSDVRIYPVWSTSLTTTRNDSLVGGVEAWQAQLEFGGRPSSVIRTSISPYTRKTSILRVPPAVDMINDSGFLLMHYYTRFAKSNTRKTLAHAYRQSGSEMHKLSVKSTLEGHFDLQMVNGPYTLDLTSPYQLPDNQAVKVAYRWSQEENRVDVFESGQHTFTNQFFTSPITLTDFIIGNAVTQDESMFGYLERILVSKLELSDDELIALTA